MQKTHACVCVHNTQIICSLIPQVLAAFDLRPHQSWEPHIPSASLTWVAGDQALEPLPLANRVFMIRKL